MLSIRRVSAIVAFFVSVVPVAGQDWPTRRVTMVGPTAPL